METPQEIAKNMEGGLAGELNDVGPIWPVCSRGVVTGFDTEDGQRIDLGDLELPGGPLTEGYIEAHPEGSDRGGYVPTVFRGEEQAHYDENAGVWV